MKYTIQGFNQKRAVELKLSSNDLTILRWFVDFMETGSMESKFIEEENKVYYWVSYKKIIEDIPIVVFDCEVSEKKKAYKKSPEQRLYDCQRQRIKRIFQGNLSKVLKRYVHRNSSGTFMFVSVDEEVFNYLIDSKENKNENVKHNEVNLNKSQIVDINSKIVDNKSSCISKNIKTVDINTKNVGNNGKNVDKHKDYRNKPVDNNFNNNEDKIKNNSLMTNGVGEILPKGLVNFDQTKINLLNNSSIKDNYKNIYSGVIDYLNSKTKSNYKSTTKKTRNLILARLNEGFTEDDFIKVIDNKCAQWLSTDYEQYLRPETLFGTKFESYLNQKVRKDNVYDFTRENFKQSKSSSYDFSAINSM